jgi:acetyl-CoA carboxylase carboxyl transferase subunit alpha
VLMFEHAVYSVISPEGCASILWRADGSETNQAALAAEAMKVTAPDLLRLGVIDRIVPEPVGGAHRDPAMACVNLRQTIGEELDGLKGKGVDALHKERAQKFLSIGSL